MTTSTKSPIRLLVWLTVALGVLPFALYYWQRASGALPSPEAWMAGGENHGPWRWELEGFALFYPMVILGAATIGHILWSLVGRRELSLAGKGAALVGLQLLLLYGQLQAIGWTID
ncbi:MAG: hypothetical protein V3U18_06975 [Alphaproteobacteria bacterium]|jgi:hypothetical protein